jgi:hypothetical protein
VRRQRLNNLCEFAGSGANESEEINEVGEIFVSRSEIAGIFVTVVGEQLFPRRQKNR